MGCHGVVLIRSCPCIPIRPAKKARKGKKTNPQRLAVLHWEWRIKSQEQERSRLELSTSSPMGTLRDRQLADAAQLCQRTSR